MTTHILAMLADGGNPNDKFLGLVHLTSREVLLGIGAVVLFLFRPRRRR